MRLQFFDFQIDNSATLLQQLLRNPQVPQAASFGMSAIMIILSLMPFSSLVLPPGSSRVLNVTIGTLYSVLMVLAIRCLAFLCLLWGIEIALTLLIA